jgi:hypothetical protein
LTTFAASPQRGLEGTMIKRWLRGWHPPLNIIDALVALCGPQLLLREDVKLTSCTDVGGG